MHVRGLLWRSHPEAMNFGEGKNLSFSRVVNEAGGQVLLDQRVRRGGSHHQKLVVVRGSDPAADVAFVGGIDLCHGRRDDARHLGDPQAVELDDEHYGARPPWHDLQLELHGPAVDDVAYSFAERWTDPTPLDSRNPVRAALHRFARHPDEPGPLAPNGPAPGDGPLAVQVLRTYPARRQPYPFAPQGERSIARAYLKAFRRARRLIYVEDQYLWSIDATRVLRESLAAHPDLQIVAVIPRYPDPDGSVAGEASRIGRERVLDALHDVGHERVAVYDLENDAGTPIYVHSKVCIVDDLWMAIGSDNLNRRSWTHDSELSCAVIDTRLDDREPADPGGLGDRARVLARDTRIRLAAEHLGRGADDARARRSEVVVRGAPGRGRRARRLAPVRQRAAAARAPARAPDGAGAGHAPVGPRPRPSAAPRSRRAPAGVAAPRRVLTAQSRSAASSASAGRGSGPTRMPCIPIPRAATRLPSKSSRRTARPGSSTPSRSSVVWKIAGSGLRTPSSHESTTRSKSSSIARRARHASPYSRMLLVTMAVRRPRARTARTASITTVRSTSSTTMPLNISPVSKRMPAACASALIDRERVHERELAALQPVPRMVRVGVVGAEDDLHHDLGVGVLRARVRVRGGERRRGEHTAVVPEDRVEVAHEAWRPATRAYAAATSGPRWSEE